MWCVGVYVECVFMGVCVYGVYCSLGIFEKIPDEMFLMLDIISEYVRKQFFPMVGP